MKKEGHTSKEPNSIKKVFEEVVQDRDPLEEANREFPVRLIDDLDPEQVLEDEETKLGEERDVIKDIPGEPGNVPAMPREDLIPEGMERAVREGDHFEEAGEDLETGED